MHETEPNNDVTPPCPDCGEVGIPCECGKPIETVAQLQRALEAAGDVNITLYRRGKRWRASVMTSGGLFSPNYRIVRATRDTLAEAVDAAIDAWWHRDD